MSVVEGKGRLTLLDDLEPGRLLAIAAIVAALLFGLAGIIGAIGYLVAVSRMR